jgi:hypothetical protein
MLDEEAGHLVQLRQNIGQEWAGRAPAGEARHLPQDVQHRIADDARARLPPASSGVGQNLATAAILFRAMPEPSTTEGWRIQGELKNLLEDAALRWAESSASQRQGYPRSIVPRLPVSCGKPRSTPSARVPQRLQPRVASAMSTTIATVEPTSTRRCAEATTPGVGDATTAGRIGVPHPNHLVRKLSAGPYDGHRSRPGSGPRLPSLSTRGKQGRNCGSRTTGWPASWVERTMTTSSSATSPYSSPTPPEHLPPAQISNWDDLLKAFAGNFQGTYVRPGNSWDLRSCCQQPGESLRDYIQRFSKQRTELPNITD